MLNNIEDILEDLENLDYGDKEIYAKYALLRDAHKKKGVPYRQLFRSKTFETVKYLMVEVNDGAGTVLITDLDSNRTFKCTMDTSDEVAAPKEIPIVQRWISAAGKAA